MYELTVVYSVPLLALVGCVRVKDDPFCVPFTYTCGPIPPSPPASYVAHVEVVDHLYNRTRYMEEFFMYQQQVMALVDTSSDSYTRSIFYYPINTAVIITTFKDVETGRLRTECVTAEIADKSPWLVVGNSSSTGPLVAVAPSQALLFGGDYKYSWVDNTTEREIPCNRWDACIYARDNDTFYVEYHWSDPNQVLDMFGFTSERPVTMKLSGEMYLDGDPRPFPILASYNFALFDDNPAWEDLRWVFEIPSDVYCAGLPDTREPPTRLADAYSMRVEVTAQTSLSPEQEFVSTVKNWYEYTRQLTRADYIPTESSEEYAIAGLVEIAAIKDFLSGVEYIIDKFLGNCTTIPIPDDEYDTITDPSGRVTIKDPLTLFGMGKVANLTYYGTKYARELPCDVWVGHLDLDTDNGTIQDSYLYEVYFLQSWWHEDSGAQTQPKYPEPVLIKIQQDITNPLYPGAAVFVDIEQNIFKFDEETPSLTVYDITPCFSGHDHIRRFQIAFPGEFRGDYDSNPVEFTDSVQDGLSFTIGIPPIRVQHVLMEFNEHDGRLYCEFTLVDQPQVANMDFPDSVGPPLGQVVLELQAAMGRLIIILYDPSYNTPGHIKMMEAYNDSLRELFEDNCTSMLFPSPFKSQLLHSGNLVAHSNLLQVDSAHLDKDDGEAHQTHKASAEPMIHGVNLHQRAYLIGKEINKTAVMYTPGDMAGMGIGMFFLGLLLGTVVMLATLSKFGLTEGMEFIAMHSRSS
ncbi:uncharacterized protein [Procambarus clarkii]|uniref:uncharacterized protein n=1 Tax=Procambarus clarkii TaxID=6728 RepID=UPI0037428F88